MYVIFLQTYVLRAVSVCQANMRAKPSKAASHCGTMYTARLGKSILMLFVTNIDKHKSEIKCVISSKNCIYIF